MEFLWSPLNFWKIVLHNSVYCLEYGTSGMGCPILYSLATLAIKSLLSLYSGSENWGSSLPTSSFTSNRICPIRFKSFKVLGNHGTIIAEFFYIYTPKLDNSAWRELSFASSCLTIDTFKTYFLFELQALQNCDFTKTKSTPLFEKCSAMLPRLPILF